MTLAEEILRYLHNETSKNGGYGYEVDSDDIAEKLDEDPGSVVNALTRLWKRQDVSSPRIGSWFLTRQGFETLRTLDFFGYGG